MVRDFVQNDVPDTLKECGLGRYFLCTLETSLYVMRSDEILIYRTKINRSKIT